MSQSVDVRLNRERGFGLLTNLGPELNIDPRGLPSNIAKRRLEAPTSEPKQRPRPGRSGALLGGRLSHFDKHEGVPGDRLLVLGLRGGE